MIKQPSLLGYFDPPDAYTGYFGWLCGYSADALFLDEALTHFTGLTTGQRATQGQIALVAMIDPQNDPISIKDVPSLAHLPIKDFTNRPFHLLHAKVALLGFLHEDRKQWALRLLVSTGNWTRQTVEESLDLVWSVELESASLKKLDSDIRQTCAELKSGWNFLSWLLGKFDSRLLEASVIQSNNHNILQKVETWVETCAKQAKGEPKFFDNRKKSLLAQLPAKINNNASGRRNYLAMGSGFYENVRGNNSGLEVPDDIINTLEESDLLTKSSEIDIYVNPLACQSVAGAFESLGKYTVRPAHTSPAVFGENSQRTLHAKFLFSANYRDNSNYCNNAWIYLGSGNLTKPGFTRKMSTNGGNLEAGVVFFPGSLRWEEDKKRPDEQVVTNMLPIQWDEEITEASELTEGADFAPSENTFTSPPLAWFTWHELKTGGELRLGHDPSEDILVFNSSDNPCPKTKTGFSWAEPQQPRVVKISWGDSSNTAFIPVIDQYGRIAATALPALEIDEVWWQLAAFPLPAAEDVAEGDFYLNDESSGRPKSAQSKAPTSPYPIRQMMELIENIAAKQTQLEECDWPRWCLSLEQILGQAKGSPPVSYFREELKLNPLSALWAEPFRPYFAENGDSIPGKLYEDTLTKIEAGWQVEALPPLGGEL